MKKNLTVAISSMFPMVQYLASKGITAEMLFSKADIDPIILKNPDARLTLAEMDLLYDQAFILTNDENLGLHAGEFFTPGSNHIVGYIMMNCTTIRKAYQKLCKYLDVSTQGVRLEVFEDKETATIDMKLLHDTVHLERHHYECILTAIATTIPQLCGKTLNPIEVRFIHPAPAIVSEHHRIFHAPVIFGSQKTCIVFEKKYMDFSILTPNKNLLSLLEKHAADVLKDILPENTTGSKVRHLLIQEFQGATPKIDFIAKKMAISVRKLQLLLKSEGTSFSKIFEDVRKKLAVAHLQENQLSIEDITYLLGFSEPSAFYRTFKRWTGQTPGEFRSRKTYSN